VGEEVFCDYASLGLSLRSHPLALLRPTLARHRLSDSRTLRRTTEHQSVAAAGLVTHRQKPETAKGVVFLTLEDEFGTINVIVPPWLAESQRQTLATAKLLKVVGLVEREDGVIQLLARRLVDLSHLLGKLAFSSRDFH
jgi:error-prone DNA polymerase